MTDYPEGWEEWVAFLTARLPEPVEQEIAENGVIFFIAGDPPEVVVRFSQSSITVSGFTSERDDPVPRRRRLGTVMWRRLPSGKAMALVTAFLGSARDMRLATYQKCYYCEKMKPPEQMHGDDLCLECAKTAIQ